jgi:hypothetical protein
MGTIYTLAQPCVAGTAYQFPVFVGSQADTDVFQTSVSLVAGDVQVSKDGGGYSNITSLPSEIGATGEITVILAGAETTGATKYITVKFHDVTGDQWQDVVYIIPMQTAISDYATTGADGDTLETLSDQLDVAQADLDSPAQYKADVSALATSAEIAALNDLSAAQVWAYATRTLSSFGTLIASIWSYATRTLTSSSTAPGVGLSAQTWTVIRGDSLDRTFATIAADATITKCQLTVKANHAQGDTDAILAVDSTTGLIRLNGENPGAFTATFVLPDGVLAVPAATMAELEATRNWYYDVQVWRGVAVETIETGRMVISSDVTRTVA